ncbi:phosphoribosylamine--glycine ligase [Candidatus Pelagibacter sp.]|nr:phosphoribosylamine--glycine ligase [Candidatus Pelagibacter sp.]
MKVGIIGSGGREHALCYAIRKSSKVKQIYCIPGNAGTSSLAKNVDLNLDNFEELKKFFIENHIDIIVVGPEKPLVDGIVDFLSDSNIKVFGPNKFASKLEGSKIFTKEICEKYQIPTAKFGVFKSYDESFAFINKSKFPIVVKADGLAAGKGVYICESKDEAQKAIKDIFNGKFGEANQILIEEFLKGEEMSFFIISDGKSFKSFGTAQDHKRVGEGDKGLNTGGMGAYSPSRLENKILENKILDKIVKPTLIALKDSGNEFIGFLYAGLMIVEGEPYLIEYNVRMGDPECQTILPRLKTDLFEIIEAVLEKKLESRNIDWCENKSLSIVLCSKGYPETYENNKKIENLNKIILEENQFIFHAGTKITNNEIFSNGGRVLNFVVKSDSFEKSRSQALELIKKLDWRDGFSRKDIGFKVIDI